MIYIHFTNFKSCLILKRKMEKIEIKNINLNNGLKLPLIGLGTFRVKF